MIIKYKNQTRTLAVCLFVLVALLGWRAGFTQDAVDQQQDIDIQTVNAKAEDAKGKANGVELRVTTLESSGATTESRLVDLESRPTTDPTVEGRLATVESDHAVAMPRLDDAEARLTVLENAVPETPPVWSMYDSAGALVGTWASRVNVGRALMNIGGFEVWAQFHVESVQWLGIVHPPGVFFKDAMCKVPSIMLHDYLPNTRNALDSFGGQVQAVVIGGNLHVADPANTVLWSGQRYEMQGTRCTSIRNQNLDPSIVFVNAGPLPTWLPPFSVSQ